MTEKEKRATTDLSNAQKKYLRGLGHHLTPLVYIGREGIVGNVIEAIDSALLSHELVKVKIVNTSSVSKHEAATHIPEQTASQLVQLIGKTLLLYKNNPKRKKEDQIKIP
ncbi:MAG: ribosome assembly RNA-binding protein YhbY [Desulfobacterales bacterium]|nr:ribosome assembly RNA-binding protein YhbY [Deltaproteobacteria bacterium]NNK96745.1 ribosome assembly RNA-binding protein YhbY [Desulfobacterales bacterium]